MYCPKCSTKLDDSSIFCRKCGYNIKSKTTIISKKHPKSKSKIFLIVAIVILIIVVPIIVVYSINHFGKPSISKTALGTNITNINTSEETTSKGITSGNTNENTISIKNVGSITGAGAPNYLEWANCVYVSGNYAYVTSWQDNALSIFDISNPSNPVHVGSITGWSSPNYLDGATSVYVDGNHAYVVSNRDHALSIFDISNPSNPVHVGSITGAGPPNYLDGANCVYISGNYAYVTSSGDNVLYHALSIFDTSNPSNPVHVGSITGDGTPNYLGYSTRVYIKDNFAYVVSYRDDVLSIFEVKNH